MGNKNIFFDTNEKLEKLVQNNFQIEKIILKCLINKNMSDNKQKQIGADSSTQREIEAKIVAKIEIEENFKSEKNVSIEYIDSNNIKDEVKFEFDFYNKEKKIIGEIYAGIGKISPGSRKKVITDCFKMVYAEKLLGYPCDKRLIFIDEKIKSVFEGYSWAAKAIDSYGIEIKVEGISEEDMEKLKNTKELQRHSNHKQ